MKAHSAYLTGQTALVQTKQKEYAWQIMMTS